MAIQPPPTGAPAPPVPGQTSVPAPSAQRLLTPDIIDKPGAVFTRPLPVVSGYTDSFRMPGFRAQAVQVINESAASVWINPTGGGQVGVGLIVPPFTTRIYPVDADHIGVAVGAPTSGALNTTTQRILFVATPLPSGAFSTPTLPPPSPGIPSGQQSAVNTSNIITIAGVANTLIRLLALDVSWSAAPSANAGVTVNDASIGTILTRYVNTTNPPPAPLAAGLTITPGASMTVSVDPGGAGVQSRLNIIYSQGT